jgi:hypothetical protein
VYISFVKQDEIPVVVLVELNGAGAVTFPLKIVVPSKMLFPVKVLFSGRMEADDPPMEIHVQGGNGEVWQRCSVLSLML